MRVPVNERVKEVPASALRAMFAGIGSLLSVMDKVRRSRPREAAAEPEVPATAATVAADTVAEPAAAVEPEVTAESEAAAEPEAAAVAETESAPRREAEPAAVAEPEATVGPR